ncbi:MAG: aminoglycoside 3'-phosphotransferase/choline kinase family protein [Candidatus Schekmanbacteria bacterium]|nr:aminoglycoside 3'-phosphotransferase/choline kinase family protein [Candidatus Schekmanbacteria bacterium]
MPSLFPEASTPEEYDEVCADERRLRPGVRAIGAELDLGEREMVRFPNGSVPVYAIGEDLVLKIYPPLDRAEHSLEAGVLRSLERRLPIPTPAVHAVGELEGWTYLLMDRLRGQSLVTAWPRLSEVDRSGLATQLGEALAALHALEPPQLEGLCIDWPGFVAEQHRTAAERQRRWGLSEAWREQIPEFLDGVELGDGGARALLHTEVMREHLLVDQSGSRWVFSGLFDFEPAMVGAPEYEFAAVGLFFSCGEARLLRRVLLAYGYRAAALDGALERRLLAYALLHRYSHLPWYLKRLPPPPGTTNLAALAGLWWGVSATGH